MNFHVRHSKNAMLLIFEPNTAESDVYVVRKPYSRAPCTEKRIDFARGVAGL